MEARILPLFGQYNPRDFVLSIERPRSVIILVKAGAPVNQTIAALSAHMEPDDAVIDGGNEWYENIEHRIAEANRRGMRTGRFENAEAESPSADVAGQPYVTQPSGFRAGNPCRACRSSLACPSSSHTLEPHPPALGPFLLTCPSSNQQRWTCSKAST